LLTADLVHVHRRGDRLLVVPLGEPDRVRARELASAALSLIKAHVGLSRGALVEAWNALPVPQAETRLARGLWKLALDRCDFDEGNALDPVTVRRDLFLQAASARKRGDRSFDRNALVQEAAEARQVTPAAIEEALYADLPTAHVLREARLPSPDALVAGYDLSQHQAVLLRAVNVRARVFCGDAAGYRALFRSLKFHRLLYTIAKLDRGAGYAIDIDGPFSLFEQTTKYGLRLALALPAIMACPRWDVTAELRWGKDRRPLRYHARGGEGPEPAAAPDLPDDVTALLSELRQLDSPWQASPSEAILDVPGIGACVPDLQFVHRETGAQVFFELLGFWSRAAVWKRVEMVERGLGQPVVFAVSKHLRVSEEVLPDEVPASLYVYARVLSASAILAKVERVAARSRPHADMSSP
jgi:predicted nuclease of restriction endonuclease-like RecB superfamily